MRALHSSQKWSSARLSLIAVTAFVSLAAMAACSPAKWHETKNVQEAPAPFTGDPRAEIQTTNNRPQDFQPGDPGYVSSQRVCAKDLKKPTEDCPEIIEQNDQVRVTNPAPEGHPDMVEVEVDDKDRGTTVGPVLVPPQYLSKQPIRLTPEESSADRYFVVENVATEKLRVYENCGAKNCHHRLVFETDMVVGQNNSSRRTWLGSYTVTKWFKFYEDNSNKYASWFNETYPAVPAAGASLQDWSSPKLLPADSKGSVRGAFGWYTAYIGPNANEQWTHGTWGWGADGDKFIQELRQSPADSDSFLASHGCTRVENEAIALMREMLPPGTKLIKIYARESTAATEATDAKPQEITWDWAITRDGVDQVDGTSADLSKVLARGVPQSEILEKGRYVLNTTATAVASNDTKGANHSGNIYGIPQSSFKGVFFVDEGRLSHYQHPRELKVGGHPDKHLPSVVLQTR